jgi:hypothetical protein
MIKVLDGHDNMERQECMGCDVELMHVPRCETCRHWEQHPPNAYPGPSGTCGIIPHPHATCGLTTGPDFGCVQWEGKE